ncbi:MAG: FecR family protein [Fuerstiella sp.]
MREEELDRLIGSLISNDISEVEIRQLRDALSSNAEFRLKYVEAVDLYASMFTLAGALDVDCQLAPTRWFNPQIGGQRFRRIGWSLVVTSAVILLCVCAFVYVTENFQSGHRQPEVAQAKQPAVPENVTPKPADAGLESATVVAQLEPAAVVAQLESSADVAWIDDLNQAMRQGVVGWRAGELIGLNNGLATVRLKSGVLCCFDGFCRLKVVSHNHVSLLKGSATFHVPEGVHGFEVDTPSGTIEDLGTTFGVSVSSDDVDAHVMSGEILIEPNFNQIPQAPIQLMVNSAVRLNTKQKTVSRIQYNQFQYRNALAFTVGVRRMSNHIRFRWSPIEASLVTELGHSSSPVLLRESTAQELTEDFVYFDSDRKVQVKIPAGTKVDSFLLHFSPVVDQNVNGEIQFMNEIVGVLRGREDLDRTDTMFMRYPERMDMSERAATRRGSDEPEDSVSIDMAGTKRTLKFQLGCLGQKVFDQVRILVRSTSE